MYIAIQNKPVINEELNPACFIGDVIGRLTNDINTQFDNYIVEGLKRKGFVFKSKFEIESFIKSNCRCDDHYDIKERIYYVNDIPFFLHRYEIKTDLTPITENGTIKVSAICGEFAYL
jgi:hypothetical protein